MLGLHCRCRRDETVEFRSVSRCELSRRQSETATLYVPLFTLDSWWRGTVVERRSLTGELSLSCARPAADG